MGGVIRLMVQKSQTTTWDKKNPVNNGIFTISTGAGFLPSTVGWKKWVSFPVFCFGRCFYL